MKQFDAKTPDKLLNLLSQARTERDNYKSIANTIIEQAKATGDYKFANEGVQNSTAEIEVLTAEIKKCALREYQATQNKNPFAGVKVKIFKVFKVVDEKAMQNWVAWNLKAAIKTVYDMKMIEKFAKENQVDGTQIDEEPRVEIASEL